MVMIVMSLVMTVDTSPPPPRQKGRGARGGGEGDDLVRGGAGVRLRPKHEWKRRHRKVSECRLGKNRYALGEEWSPNLGPPFGVWTCIQCVCEKVRKKSKFVGKVRCRNVKSECPKVSCDTPVVLPNQCCKSCPSPSSSDTLSTTTHLQDFLKEQEEEDEELTGRDFAVLLNGRTSLTPMTTARVATGRLFLRRRTLRFSFLLEEEGMPTPYYIQFLNEAGEILEQLEPQPTPYEATNNKVCGTWTRVPREYRSLLLEEKMWVSLNPSEESGEDTISGQILRYVGVDTEVFSALLTPTHPNQVTPAAHRHTLSGGGTAIISVDRRTDSLHVSLVFNGVFAPHETHNATLRVELLPERGLDPVTETVTLQKVYSDLNRAELMTTLGERSLIRLSRGQVRLKMWSVASPNLALEGAITPRATCNVFCAVLSESPIDDAALSATQTVPQYGAGWAVLTLSNDGTFHYQIYVEGLRASSVTLETRHRRRHREITDLTDSYWDGWANGTYDRPTYRDLDALLRDRIDVVVKGGTDRKLQGTLTFVAITEALRSPHPVLLSSPQVPMAAAVWVAVDSACVAHYDVMVAGTPPGGADEPLWSLVLREDDHVWDPRFEFNKEYLEDEVQGWELFAHTQELLPLSLSRIGAEVSYLDLQFLPNTTAPQRNLTGRVRGVSVPSVCLLDPSGRHSQTAINWTTEGGSCVGIECIKDNAANPIPITTKCIDEEKKVYDNGKSWQSPHNRCQMCMCKQGVIVCEDTICPVIECTGAYTPPDHCCPVCPDTINLDESKMCELNDQRHYVGSIWHPFLSPTGFDKCVSCSCELGSRGQSLVNCSRVPCPDLPCGPKDMENLPGSCCATCRPPEPLDPAPIAAPGMVNEGERRTEEDHRNSILNDGGCLWNNKLYENGDRWHPRINSIGFIRCVVCTCKAATILCAHVKCPNIQCHEITLDRQECCPHCVNESTTLPQPPLTTTTTTTIPRLSRAKKRKSKHKSRRRNFSFTH